MVSLTDTTNINDEDAFIRDIAWPAVKYFEHLTGDKDSVGPIFGLIYQEFKRKGFGPLPSVWDRMVLGEHRYMRLDIDEKTHGVLITNGYGYKHGTTFTPYPEKTEETNG